MNMDTHGHVVVPEILRSEAHPESWRPVITREPNGWQIVRNDRFVNGPIPKEILEWPMDPKPKAMRCCQRCHAASD